MAKLLFYSGVPNGLLVKNLPTNAGDTRDSGSNPGWEYPLE